MQHCRLQPPSVDQYLTMLSDAGFVDIDYTDISQTFVRQYNTSGQACTSAGPISYRDSVVGSST